MSPSDYRRISAWLLREEQRGEALLREKKRPLSPQMAEKLARFKNAGNIVDDVYAILGGKECRCPICRDKIAVGETVLGLPCGHLFHPDCILPYLKENDRCPLCRLDIVLAFEL